MIFCDRTDCDNSQIGKCKLEDIFINMDGYCTEFTKEELKSFDNPNK